MTARMKTAPKSPGDHERLKSAACAAAGCQTFAELAVVTLASQFLKKGRRTDARRLLHSYLKRHGSTPRLRDLLWSLA